MNNFMFYYPEAVKLSDKISFPVFHFTDELQELAPEVKWTIIGKPMAMLDCHVAECYGKRTKNFNTQVQRNQNYFKSDWRFKPIGEEWKALKLIANEKLTDVAAKCSHISKNTDNKKSKKNFYSFSLKEILGSAFKSPSPPWFYTKKGIDMAAFFQRLQLLECELCILLKCLMNLKVQYLTVPFFSKKSKISGKK